MPRNPEYYRAGKRKRADGQSRLSKGACESSFIFARRRRIQGKKRRSTKKRRDHQGLDAEQFTQTAMIAQGDFLKLLLRDQKRGSRFSPACFRRLYAEKMQEELKTGQTEMVQLWKKERNCKKEMEQVEFPCSRQDGRLVSI